MSKIVIGFDGSGESLDALHLGSALAHAMDADLIVAAASSSPLDLDVSEAAHFTDVFDQARRELPHRDFAMRELRDVAAAPGLNELAAREGAACIVIGSTHRGKVGRALPGSVGERLLAHAPCAVMVAPRGFARREHFGLGLIGVAFDGSDESQLALEAARELAAGLDAQLRVITIVPPAEPGTTRALDVVRHDRARDVQQRGRAELPPSLEVEFILDEGDPVATLAGHGVDLDLLVIGSRGHGPIFRTILGGVSADVMRTAPCPVLVVPRTAIEHAASEPARTEHGHAGR
jgi:nucleotide-binding universal stress UspA family protein